MARTLPPNRIFALLLLELVALGTVLEGFLLASALGMVLAVLWGLSHALLLSPRVRDSLFGAPQDPLAARIAALPAEDRARYAQLRARCRSFLPATAPSPVLSDALGHLLRAYLELLFTQQRIVVVANDSASTRELDARARSLRDRLANRELGDELRQSLVAQLELVERRRENWKSANDKLDLITAELRRIEDHVELLREQELLAVDPVPASQQIDTVTAALRDTDAWLAEQRALFDLAPVPPAPVELGGEG